MPVLLLRGKCMSMEAIRPVGWGCLRILLCSIFKGNSGKRLGILKALRLAKGIPIPWFIGMTSCTSSAASSARSNPPTESFPFHYLTVNGNSKPVPARYLLASVPIKHCFTRTRWSLLVVKRRISTVKLCILWISRLWNGRSYANLKFLGLGRGVTSPSPYTLTKPSSSAARRTSTNSTTYGNWTFRLWPWSNSSLKFTWNHPPAAVIVHAFTRTNCWCSGVRQASPMKETICWFITLVKTTG